MSDIGDIAFVNNSAAENADGKYMDITVSTARILESWRESVFSFEWLTGEGAIKAFEDLSETEKPKREAIEAKIAAGEALEKPVLGIGLQDNVEIGAGRAEFLTLAARGLTQIPVHILKSNESDFKDFLAEVDS